MTGAEIDALDVHAHACDGWEVGTTFIIIRSQLAELCRLARIGKAAEAEAGKP